MMIDAVHLNGRCPWWGRLSDALIHYISSNQPPVFPWKEVRQSQLKTLKQRSQRTPTHCLSHIPFRVRCGDPHQWKLAQSLKDCSADVLHHREHMHGYIAGSQ